MKRTVAGILLALVCLGIFIAVIARPSPFLAPSANAGTEPWRNMDVADAGKAFDATGSDTDFLTGTTDDNGAPVILGLSDLGNGVPWIAQLGTDWTLADPTLLTDDPIRTPRPEGFVIKGNSAAFFQNINAGEKGGGVYSDFDLFDAEANEISRYYRFNFRNGSTFHKRALVTDLDRLTGQQTLLRPFGERDSHLTSLIATPSRFVAGGYVVPEGQLGARPALTYWTNLEQGVETLMVQGDFGPGSHWIDDIAALEGTSLLVLGATAAPGDTSVYTQTGWLGIVDTKDGVLRPFGERFPTKGRSLLRLDDNGPIVVTATHTMRFGPSGKLLWSVAHADTLPGSGTNHFVPRSVLLNRDGNIWVAGSAANDDWFAWAAQISKAGDVSFGSVSGWRRNGARFIDLIPADDGGVLAVGTLYCRHSKCAPPFSRGFLLQFDAEGGIAETEQARFETFAKRQPELDFYNPAPRVCTQVDARVCDAVATLGQTN